MVLLLSSYILLVVFFIYQWSQIPAFTPLFNFLVPDKISVVIAAKNEAENILNLLKSIENQTLDKKNFELIIINDFSTDNTVEIINKCALESKIAIRLYPNSTPGKKSAIEKGIRKADNELIVCTDADCIVSPKWLETIAHFFKEKNAKLVFGGVAIEAVNDHIFHQMQQIEFASLVGSGAASWQAGMPNMCNGANIAYTKTAFDEAKGFEGNEEIASGDDEFLMHKIFTKHPKEVFFLKSADALVFTKPINSLKAFYEQRSRWASKWEHYTDWKVKAMAFYIFAINLFQIVSYFFVPVSVFLGMWALRMLAEYLFLSSVLGFMDKKLNLKAFLLLVLIYPIYVVFFALAGRIKSFAK